MTDSTRDIPPLDPENWEEYRQLAHEMLDDSLDYLRDVRDRPTWKPMPADVRKALGDEPVPREGVGDAAAYEDFLHLVRPYPNGNIHPRFWGWVMGTGTPQSAMADFLASTMNPNVGGFEQSPMMVEKQVVKWYAELMGYPKTSGGVLVNGGTMANVICLAAARHHGAGYDIRKLGLRGGPQLTVYGSSETHSWLKKSCEFLGLGVDAFRKVPVDAAFRVDVKAMAKMIADDRAAGLRPFCIVGTSGTVQTGTTDDLHALADLAAKEKLWFHIDGAFGAMAKLAPGALAAAAVDGLERADSIAFDLHKWGYLPYDVAMVLTKDDKHLVDAFSVQAAYLTPESRGLLAGTGIYFSERTIELSRSFKALKVWMSLKTHGADLIGQHIARNIEQTQYLARLVEASTDLELLAPAPLNILVFRFVTEGKTDAELDALNREILVRLQEDGIAVPSGTTIKGKFAIRVANTNHRTNDDDLRLLTESTVSIGRSLTAS
jgi:aromatic-L-amino-acid decarboxylase